MYSDRVMPHNVPHTHISVNGHCALRAISRDDFSRYDVRMANRHPIYLREWRKHSGKTLVEVAELVGMTHGQLSKIERGKQPYNSSLLDALADIYGCHVVDLISREPETTRQIWSLWDRATDGEREKIVAIVQTLVEDATATG